VRRGAWLALTTILSHFPELEVKLDLLGCGYDVDLSCDEMEALWTQTRGASESLSSWVPSLVTRSPPEDAGEEYLAPVSLMAASPLSFLFFMS
jgi:hypothetical protein